MTYPGTFAATTPDKAAVILADTGETVTYAELEDRSARLARALHDLGLRRGDVVSMLSDNAVQCLEIYWAALRSGLYLSAVNHHLTPDEVAYIVNDSEARVLIASGGLAGLAEAVLEVTPAVEHRFGFGEAIGGHASYDELLAGAAEPLTAMPRGADMLYSSGTTGRPKGVKPPLSDQTVDQPESLSGLVSAFMGGGPDTVYLSVSPIYHAAPLRFCAALQSLGATVVMTRRFDAEQSLRLIEAHSVTMLQMVPTMFVRLLQLPQQVRASFSHDTLRTAIHAAAPCPPDVKAAMIDWWGPVLVEYYSSTEGNGLTLITAEEWLTHRGSVGRAVLGETRICDEEGRELPAGEVGTVYFARDEVPFGYHGDPEKTADATHPLHPTWTTVGDLGYVDEDGYLYLTDRKAFTIISGGVNIYPQETENALALHPAIHDVGVIGTPDAEMGEQVTAYVALRPGHEPSDALAAEIIAHVRERIATYKAPRAVVFVDELPRTPTGKLVKRRLRELASPTEPSRAE